MSCEYARCCPVSSPYCGADSEYSKPDGLCAHYIMGEYFLLRQDMDNLTKDLYDEAWTRWQDKERRKNEGTSD